MANFTAETIIGPHKLCRMNTPNIAYSSRITAGCQPMMNFGAYLAAPTDNNHHYAIWSAWAFINKPALPLTAMLAHEMRNPLTNINLSAEMIGSLVTDDKLKEYVDIIACNSARVNGLINKLLEYLNASRAETESHSIYQLLDNVLLETKDRAMRKKIVIKKEYIADDRKTIFNMMSMKMALTNIVINAIDAVSPGKGELRIVAKVIGGKFIVQINDNGCGIKEENLKYIFTPYFTSKPGGLGVGLAMAYNIFWSNNIGVNVRSREAEGTCFSILF